MKQNQNENIGENKKGSLKAIASMVGLGKSPSEAQQIEPEEVTEDLDFKKFNEDVATIKAKAVRRSETSVVADDVVIDGTIHASGALDCRGTINGDLIAKGAIIMSGKQVGNIQGSAINFVNAIIEGNVLAEGNVEVDSGSKIIGNINGGNILIDGRVTGIICGEGLVCLRRNAVLSGDIKSAAISIEEGVKINGQITMKSEEKKTK